MLYTVNNNNTVLSGITLFLLFLFFYIHIFKVLVFIFAKIYDVNYALILCFSKATFKTHEEIMSFDKST